MTKFKPKEPRYDDIYFEGVEQLDKIARGEVEERKLTKEEVRTAWDVPKESTTCWRCQEKDVCKYAFDPYNTDGDCLAYK